MAAPPRLDPPTVRTAIRDSIFSAALGGILPQVLFQGGVITLLVLHLGGRDVQVGIISTMANACMIMGVFLAPYVEVRPRLRLFRFWIVISTAAAALLFLVFPLARVASPRIAFIALVIIVFLHRSSNNLAGSAWMPYLADLVPAPLRGRYFGRMRMTWRTTSLLVTLAAGWILGRDPGATRFSLVIAVGLFFYTVRFVFIARLPPIEPIRRGRPESLLGNLTLPFADRFYRRFLGFLFVVYFAVSAAWPFVIPFLKRELSFPSSAAVYAASFIAVGSIFSLLPWGKLADRQGSRFVFFVSITVIAGAYLLFVTTPSFDTTPALAFALAAAGFTIRGVGVSGLGIAYTVRSMHEAPPERRGSYMIVARLVVGTAAALGPLAAGLLLDNLPETAVLAGTLIPTKRPFFAAALLLVLAAAPLITLLRHLREERTRQILKHMLFTSMQRLGNQLALLARISARNDRTRGNHAGEASETGDNGSKP